MRVLGYSATWRTRCFINSDCGAEVFAHTNGNGDFVLFDALGWPWPIHDCYIDRFCYQPGGGDTEGARRVFESDDFLLDLREDALDDYFAFEPTKPPPKPDEVFPRDIKRCDPKDYMSKKFLRVAGYIQDIVEDHLARLLRDCGELIRQNTLKSLGTKKSQITVVDENLNSYTMFIDLGDVVITRGALVEATIRPTRLFGLRKDYAFVCTSLEVPKLFSSR